MKQPALRHRPRPQEHLQKTSNQHQTARRCRPTGRTHPPTTRPAPTRSHSRATCANPPVAAQADSPFPDRQGPPKQPRRRQPRDRQAAASRGTPGISQPESVMACLPPPPGPIHREVRSTAEARNRPADQSLTCSIIPPPTDIFLAISARARTGPIRGTGSGASPSPGFWRQVPDALVPGSRSSAREAD